MLPVALLLLIAVSAWSQCPLGLTPEEACNSAAPTCRFFDDADGDGQCDNPSPAASESSDSVSVPPVEEPGTPTSDVHPDSSATTPDYVPDSGGTPGEPDDVFTPVLEPSDTTAAGPGEIHSDTLLANPVEAAGDTLTAPASRCPLGYAPLEACHADSPGCALFVDADGDSFCDNPGPQLSPDSAVAGPDTTPRRAIAVNGCPLSLPPAAACPFESRLCPHWLGWNVSSSCLNPSHGFTRGTSMLAITAALLITATFLSRRIRGRRNRKKAKISRTIVLVLSLALLGFALQGCYCPLGLFQFMLIPGMLAGVLGWIGMTILLFPVVHAMLFGRVYCGWACPMGALQELLGRLPVKGKPSIPRRADALLLKLRYVLAILFTAAVVLAGRGIVDARWGALFCSVDPFHTVFSLFIAGSLLSAVILVILSVFFGRFFCRYLCFYGVILGLACRVGLWTRLCRLVRSREMSCAGSSGEQSCEVGSAED
ncbi:4Fe-4S binding protein [Candidatus Fermentibacteria bacterium]|nr:4Fe-4S binding protein [Candidatus Fermentibacteria bacterium]